MYPDRSQCKPLLQRMAEEKRFQMERGSIGGSYFVVKLPDGTTEKRLKVPINIDPGVHSSFNLDQLVPGTPLTPVPTVPTLPTITEVKIPDHSGSSGGSSNGSGELKTNEKQSTKIEDVAEEDEQNDSGEEKKKNQVAEENEKNKDMVEEENKKNLKEVESPDSSGKETEEKNESKDQFTEMNERKIEENGTNEPSRLAGVLPRNASQPTFSSTAPGLRKNGSVPSFDRMKRPGYRPSLGTIKVSRSNLAVNGEARKLPGHLRLSNMSFHGSRNNNCEDTWSKTDVSSFLLISARSYRFN